MDFNNVDEKTAFKMGFAARCFELGLTPAQVEDAMEKSARLGFLLPYLRSGGAAALSGLKSVGRGLGWSVGASAPFVGLAGLQALRDSAVPAMALGAGVPIAASLAAGGGLGWGAAKLNEPSTTPEDIQAQELKNTYEQYTNRLKARRAYQQYRDARGMA